MVLLPSSWQRTALTAALWLLPLVFSTRCLDTAVRWRSTRQAAKTQDGVTGNKRKLYGLAPPEPKPEPLRQRRPFSLTPGRGGATAAAAGPQSTPITPPQRYAGPTSATGVPLGSGFGLGTPYSAASGVLADGRTPMSDALRRSPQPPGFSPGGVVASPEQLSYYLGSLTPGVGAGAGAAAAAASPAADPMAGLYGYTTAAAAYGTPGEQDQSATGTLPVGTPPPAYRMTWMPKKAAAVVAADTALTPSPAEEVEDFVVAVLRARQDWLELWTERLREWMADRVLRPLVAAVNVAHEPVNALFQQFNQVTRLPPLPDVLSDTRAAGGGDVDGVLRALQGSLAQAAAGQPANTPAAAKVKELLAAVNRYSELLAVVRGKRPSDLLPPSNTAYVWTRLQQLATSSCLKDFTWNGGAAYGGRAWSPDLPNDSALVLYLFAAYLDAPGWQFTAPPNTQADGAAQPLFLGSMAAGPRAAGPCSAILTYRPEKPSKDLDALLGLNLASSSPLFCYLAAGRLLVLAHYQYVAVFHAILFFLQYHKVRYGGLVGRQDLADPDLALDAVVAPPAPGSRVALGTQVLGLGRAWFG